MSTFWAKYYTLSNIKNQQDFYQFFVKNASVVINKKRETHKQKAHKFHVDMICCILRNYVLMYRMVLPVTVGGYALKQGLLLPPWHKERGLASMVTYSDLIQLGILIVGIISLFITANSKK